MKTYFLYHNDCCYPKVEAKVRQLDQAWVNLNAKCEDRLNNYEAKLDTFLLQRDLEVADSWLNDKDPILVDQSFLVSGTDLIAGREMGRGRGGEGSLIEPSPGLMIKILSNRTSHPWKVAQASLQGRGSWICLVLACFYKKWVWWTFDVQIYIPCIQETPYVHLMKNVFCVIEIVYYW